MPELVLYISIWLVLGGRGTADMTNKAEKAGLPVIKITYRYELSNWPKEDEEIFSQLSL